MIWGVLGVAGLRVVLLLGAGLAGCAPPGQVGGAGPAGAVRVELPSRPGVVQPVLFTAASAPVASVILFPGGDGVLGGLGNNFLVRVSGQMAAAGLNVVLADAPSDQGGGMETAFRSGAAQAQDAGAMVAFLRGKSAVPVWVVGTSRGSISAANAAVRLGPSQVAGLVLTSAVWADGMEAVPLGRVAVPTLVVHNRGDGCAEFAVRRGGGGHGGAGPCAGAGVGCGVGRDWTRPGVRGDVAARLLWGGGVGGRADGGMDQGAPAGLDRAMVPALVPCVPEFRTGGGAGGIAGDRGA